MKDRKAPSSLARVAEVAGVSKMTASRVLRDAGGFSEATRLKVLAAADQLDYVPNRLAAAFGSETASTLVGVLVPRLSSGLFGEVVEGLDRTLSRFGYQTMIGAYEQVPEWEEKWLRSVLSWRPAGLILTGRHHSKATQSMLRAASLPLVEMWELNTKPVDVSVGINHYDCGYEMGRLLVGRGHRVIGYLGAEEQGPGMGQVRSEGFAAALTHGGAELTDREVLKDRPGFYAGYYGTEILLARRPGLDAIYYQNDAMAVGGMAFCKARGLRIPDDIGIAGWGGMEVASIQEQRLTTTTVAAQGLGKAAAEALIARIQGEPVSDAIEIKTRLVPGATV